MDPIEKYRLYKKIYLTLAIILSIFFLFYIFFIMYLSSLPFATGQTGDNLETTCCLIGPIYQLSLIMSMLILASYYNDKEKNEKLRTKNENNGNSEYCNKPTNIIINPIKESIKGILSMLFGIIGIILLYSIFLLMVIISGAIIDYMFISMCVFIIFGLILGIVSIKNKFGKIGLIINFILLLIIIFEILVIFSIPI